jgi:SAM-dependent methyltransferase
MGEFGISDYESYWQSRFDQKHYQFMDVHRKIIEVARDILGDGEARILDCGVGPGHVFEILSQQYDVHGIEISKEAFSLYKFNTEQITVWDLNQGLPEYPHKMDLVIASRIIHHLDDPVAFLAHVRRTLKDKGWFMGVVPNICYYHHRIKFLLGKFPPISKAHKNFQSGPEFEKMVASEGFTFHTLTTPKKTIRAKIWPTAFSQDLIYVFRKE